MPWGKPLSLSGPASSLSIPKAPALTVLGYKHPGVGVFPEAKGPQAWNREEAAGPEVSRSRWREFPCLTYIYTHGGLVHKAPRAQQRSSLWEGRTRAGPRSTATPQSSLPRMPTWLFPEAFLTNSAVPGGSGQGRLLGPYPLRALGVGT